MAYGSVACAVIDPIISGLLSLTSGQIEVLKDNLQNLSEYTKNEFLRKRDNNKQDKTNLLLYDNIKKCINHHNAVLK